MRYGWPAGNGVRRRMAVWAALIVGLMGPGGVRAADTPATYVGPSGGNWNTGANWSTAPTVPANAGGATFAVTIPTSTLVAYDRPGLTSVNALTLNSGASLNLAAGDHLTVVNTFSGSGSVVASGATFAVSGAASGGGGSFYANAAGVITVPNLATLNPGQGSEVRADGANAQVNLLGLGTVALGSANNYVTFQAYNGGLVDARNLATVGGTSGAGVPLRVLSFNAGSVVNLSGLSTVPANTLGLDIRDGGTVLWGNPATVQGAAISKTGAASVLNTASLSNADRTTFYINEGATAVLPALHAYAPGEGSELRADGAGSKLDLSGLNTLALGAANNFVTVEAYNGGVVDAHNLTAVTGTSGAGVPLRVRSWYSGSVANLSGLTAIPADVLALDIRDNATVLWGNPSTVQGASIVKSGAGSVLNTASLSNADRTTFYINDGATAVLPALHTYAPGGGTELRANGAGSKLDLSGLNTIALGAGNNFVNLEAYNGGVVDARNLTAFTGTSGVVQPLRVQSFGAGSAVNVSGLAAIPAGYLNLDLRDGGTVVWSKPAAVVGATINMTNGATLDTTNLASFANSVLLLNNATTTPAALSSAVGSSFYLSGGGTLALPALHAYTAGPIATEFRADGAGTKLDLTGLTALEPGASGNFTTFDARNGGTVDARNLAAVAGPFGVTSPLRVASRSAGSVVDVSGLASGFPVNVGPRAVSFDVRGGGLARVKDLVAYDQVFVADAGSRLTVGGSLAVQGNVLLRVDPGATVGVKRDLSFAHTDEALVPASGGAIVFDGSGLQRVEAGGADVGLATGTLVNDNFSFGRLVVGQAGQATIVEVRDELDNGNRGGGGGGGGGGGAGAEAVYLFGPRGRTGGYQAGDADAVDVLGGSTLLIRNTNVYALQGGVMVNLQSLIPQGQRRVAYKGGFLSRSFSAVPGGWNVNGDGNYATPGNWLDGAAPSGAGASAVFGDKITAPRTVTIGAATPLGFVGFDGAFGYTLSGGGSIVLSNAGGVRAGIHVNADAGNANHVVNVPLELQADVDLVSYSTGTLSLNGALLNAGGRTVIKDGPGLIAIAGPQSHGAGARLVTEGGTLRLDSDAGGAGSRTAGLYQAGGVTLMTVPQHLASLDVSGGVARVAAGGAAKAVVVSAATFGPAGQLDLTDRNGLIVDYAAGGPNPVAAVRAAVLSGANRFGTPYTGPGITSSTAAANPAYAVGYATSADLFGGAGTFAGQSVDGTAVLARATLAGDATLNGVVDFDDLVRLAQNYNTTVSATTESWWFNGDFTGNGVTDFDDLVKLAQNYNTALPAGAVPGASASFGDDLSRAFAGVPEPGAGVLVVVAWGMAVRRGRRRRFV